MVFGLSHTVIHCSKATTLDDVRDGLLVEGKPMEQETDVQGHGVGFSSGKVCTVWSVFLSRCESSFTLRAWNRSM